MGWTCSRTSRSPPRSQKRSLTCCTMPCSVFSTGRTATSAPPPNTASKASPNVRWPQVEAPGKSERAASSE